MFNSKTTFIIGAGASKEAGLPIGNELTAKIGKLVNFHVEFGRDVKRGDPIIYNAIHNLVQAGGWEGNSFIGSGRQMAAAMALAPSIDTFLETHSENREFVILGKMGIVRAITLAEKASLLATRGDNNQPFQISDLNDTWYISLAQQLFSGVKSDNPQSAFKDIRFVVFNYDRCLEVFLIEALKVYFGTQHQTAEKIVDDLDIIHPYGHLGSIREGEKNYLPFGREDYNLISVYERIKTFSESLDSDAIDGVKSAIAEAETLIFLGFGFGDQNMELIAPQHPDQNFEIE